MDKVHCFWAFIFVSLSPILASDKVNYSTGITREGISEGRKLRNWSSALLKKHF